MIHDHWEYIVAQGYVKDTSTPDPNFFVLMFLLTSNTPFQRVENPWFKKLCGGNFTPMGRNQLGSKFLPQAKANIIAQVRSSSYLSVAIADRIMSKLLSFSGWLLSWP